MESTQMLACTQALDNSTEQEETVRRKQLVGRLEVVGGAAYGVHAGETRIGRDPSTCDIVLTQPSISRVHAIIEADADGAVIYDPGSSNGTKSGGIKMRKNIRYNLHEGSKLCLGDVHCVWRSVDTAVEAAKSEEEEDERLSTCSNLSESLFDGAEDEENQPPNFVPETPAPMAKEKQRIPVPDELTFLPESQSSPLPNSSIKSHKTSFKIPDSPGFGLDTSSFLAPSQPQFLPKGRPGGPSKSTTSLTAPAAAEKPHTGEQSWPEDISVIADSDEEDDTANRTSVIVEKDSLYDEVQQCRSDLLLVPSGHGGNDTARGDDQDQSMKDDRREFDLFIAASPVANTRLSNSALLCTKTQDVDKELSDSALLYAQTQAVDKQLSDSTLQCAQTQAIDKELSDSALFCVQTIPGAIDKRLSDSALLSIQTQAINKPIDSTTISAHTQAVDKKLSDSALLCAQTQDVDKQLSDSALLYAQTQAVEKQLSDSALLCAQTQAMDKQLSDSALLCAQTQAVDKHLSDSALLCAQTQAVDKQLSDSALLCAQTQAVHLVDSELLKTSTKGSKGKLSDSELFFVPSQTIINKRLSESELHSATQTVDGKALYSELSRDASHVPESVHSQLLYPASPDTPEEDPSEAETQSLFVEAETQSFLLETQMQQTAAVVGTQSVLDAETQAILKELSDPGVEAETMVSKLRSMEDDIETGSKSLPREQSEFASQDRKSQQDEFDGSEENIAENEKNKSQIFGLQVTDLEVVATIEQRSDTDIIATCNQNNSLDFGIPQLARTSTQILSSEAKTAVSCVEDAVPSMHRASTKTDMFDDSRQTEEASVTEPPKTTGLFTDSNFSFIASSQSQDDYCVTRNPVEVSEGEYEDVGSSQSSDNSHVSENLLEGEYDNFEFVMQPKESGIAAASNIGSISPIVSKAGRGLRMASSQQVSTSVSEERQVDDKPDTVFHSIHMPTCLSQQADIHDHHVSRSLMETSVQVATNDSLSVGRTAANRFLAETNYSAVSMLESSVEPAMSRAASRLFSATNYASVSMDETSVAQPKIILSTKETPQKQEAVVTVGIDCNSPILSRSRSDSQEDAASSASLTSSLQLRLSCSIQGSTDSPVLGRAVKGGPRRSHENEHGQNLAENDLMNPTGKLLVESEEMVTNQTRSKAGDNNSSQLDRSRCTDSVKMAGFERVANESDNHLPGGEPEDAEEEDSESSGPPERPESVTSSVSSTPGQLQDSEPMMPPTQALFDIPSPKNLNNDELFDTDDHVAQIETVSAGENIERSEQGGTSNKRRRSCKNAEITERARGSGAAISLICGKRQSIRGRQKAAAATEETMQVVLEPELDKKRGRKKKENVEERKADVDVKGARSRASARQSRSKLEDKSKKDEMAAIELQETCKDETAPVYLQETCKEDETATVKLQETCKHDKMARGEMQEATKEDEMAMVELQEIRKAEEKATVKPAANSDPSPGDEFAEARRSGRARKPTAKVRENNEEKADSKLEQQTITKVRQNSRESIRTQSVAVKKLTVNARESTGTGNPSTMKDADKVVVGTDLEEELSGVKPLAENTETVMRSSRGSRGSIQPVAIMAVVAEGPRSARASKRGRNTGQEGGKRRRGVEKEEDHSNDPTQPYLPIYHGKCTDTVETCDPTTEQPTQPYVSSDPEILFPGNAAIEDMSDAPTQPISEQKEANAEVNHSPSSSCKRGRKTRSKEPDELVPSTACLAAPRSRSRGSKTQVIVTTSVNDSAGIAGPLTGRGSKRSSALEPEKEKNPPTDTPPVRASRRGRPKGDNGSGREKTDDLDVPSADTVSEEANEPCGAKEADRAQQATGKKARGRPQKTSHVKADTEQAAGTSLDRHNGALPAKKSLAPSVDRKAAKRSTETSAVSGLQAVSTADEKSAVFSTEQLSATVEKGQRAKRSGTVRPTSRSEATICTDKRSSVKRRQEVTAAVTMSQLVSPPDNSAAKRQRGIWQEQASGKASKRKQLPREAISSEKEDRVDRDDSPSASPSLRRVSIGTKYRVIFTGYQDTKDSEIVKELGGQMTEDVRDCTVIVADQIKRTAKFLCGVARGLPIVSPRWLTESRKAGLFLDPWTFILRDEANEKKWGFKLEATLHQASRRRLLSSVSVHVTKQVTPPPEQLRDILESGGGTFLTSMPDQASEGTYIISCKEDKAVHPKLRRAGLPVMDKEFILSGILRYKLDPSLLLQ